MFTASASWYDLFYASKDYVGEAAAIAELVSSLRPRAKKLLDVGCGTGRHLEHLGDHFDCEGLDLDPELLSVARGRLPNVPLTRADMMEFELGRRFDAVICLFSAIGYMRTPSQLEQAVSSMARHVEPGGVLIIEPWVLPEDWIEPGTNVVNEVEDGGRRLVRVVSSRRDGRLSHLRIHYVVAEAGTIETADEDHFLGLFTKSDYLDAVHLAGIAASWVDETLFQRGLVVGVKG